MEEKFNFNQNYYTTQFDIIIDKELHRIEENTSQFVLSLYFSRLNLELTDFKLFAYDSELAQEERIQEEEIRIVEILKESQSLFIKSDLKEFQLSEYEEFINLINKSAYDDKYYRILPILLRNLFENLLYDTFQTGLDKKHTEFYFLKSQSRARDFSQLIALLNILKDRDFKPYHKDSLNQSIIDVLKQIQMFGNWTVHHILRQVDMDFADKREQKVNRLLLALLVFYKKIRGETLEITNKDTLNRINVTLNLVSPDDTLKPKITNWKIIIQEENISIDEKSVINSLEPDMAEGDVLKLECNVEKSNWNEIKKNLEYHINYLFNEREYYQFAIFSLARISCAMYLGYLLTTRIKVRYSQYQRDSQTWDWIKELEEKELPKLQTSGLLNKEKNKIKEVIIKISLSAKILEDQIKEIGLDIKKEIEITIDNPSEDWLKSETQLIELSKSFRDILNNLRKFAPNLNTIHLFYAGPTAGAIAIGRQINPRMTPIIQIYEFDRIKIPKYQKSIIIGGD